MVQAQPDAEPDVFVWTRRSTSQQDCSAHHLPASKSLGRVGDLERILLKLLGIQLPILA